MDFVEHLKKSIYLSDKEESKLTDDLLNLSGMSSYKVRHLLNNLCNFDGCNYFEVGTWTGSTLLAACYKNKCNAYACENWSQYIHGEHDIKGMFADNLKNFLNKDEINFNFLEFDCFDITEEHIKDKINVYLYDGYHDFKSHVKAFTYFEKFFDDKVIMIVDDYGKDPPTNDFKFRTPNSVRFGTEEGLKELKNYSLTFSKELPPLVKYDRGYIDKDYWCGLRVMVLEKK